MTGMLGIEDTSFVAAMAAATLPLLAFALIMLFTRRHPGVSAGLSVGAVTVSLTCALFLLVRHGHMEAPLAFATNWLVSGDLVLSFGCLLDPVSLLMLTIVSVISFLVQVYSLGYMAGDRGFARYFAFQSLFAWAMMSLCIAPNLLQLYVFWELVGLSSYLLIGFWYEKWSASQAGKKAFVMTRLGDIAFFVGLLLVLLHLGNLNILEVNGEGIAAKMSPTLLTVSALLIFGGIMGKSAQFPLLTWLPDAMEGPTPVSALLHSATMVAAGVYLFARIFPFFSLSPDAMAVCLAIGTVTMLLASTMAMVSRDIKQVWAYSTISQLGFMIMGLSAGSFVAGVFHLTTHAGFKALLFLCSGVFIHRFETNDMFALGRLGCRGLRVPMVCMVVAAAALSGLPPLSGFFSKEAIMGGLAALRNPVWLVAGLLGAFLTAYYAFRLVFVILFPAAGEGSGEEEGDAHGGAHAHTGRHDWLMLPPLVVLALVTLGLGFAQGSLETFLAGGHAEAHGGHAGHHTWLLFTAVGLAAAGVGLAWLEFGRRGSAQVGFVERIPWMRDLFAERWYLDHFYRWFVDNVVHRGFSRLFSENDRRVIDGGVDGAGRAIVEGGRWLARLQSGLLQSNLVILFAVVALIVLFFFL